MPLTDTDIAAIDGVLSRPGLGADCRAAIAMLRASLPGLAVLTCDAADVLEEPWRRYAGIDLHFIDTRNHCAEMTNDPARATGLLLAARPLVLS